MRMFDFSRFSSELLSPEIVKALTTIHEYKGKQELYLETHADVLATLTEVAKVQSTDASNRIEGIYTTDKRLHELMKETTAPKNRNEEEIAGYRDVLAMVHESYDYIEPKPPVILQFHRDLYRYTNLSFAGSWKNVDNIIAEVDEDGGQRTRFKPQSAVATPMAMDALCNTYQNVNEQETYDSLLLLIIFIFDFICIHPFNDGNGRMNRLLTLLLLYRGGYLVGKYISIEKLIEQSKETYYEALQASSPGWHEGENDYVPFVRYMLGILVAAYSQFADRVEGLVVGRLTKAERVESIFDQKLGKITKKDILEQCPDISETTVERTLANLLAQGKIKKTGAGRSTGYVRTFT